MRLWSLHPEQLDRVGLVACWRESLLAQNVLAGNTRGYRNHPQLTRFRGTAHPLGAMGAYLSALQQEATARGYRFDATKIREPEPSSAPLTVTDGQLAFEWDHLGRKLAERDSERWEEWRVAEPQPHPLFRIVSGDIESWERP